MGVMPYVLKLCACHPAFKDNNAAAPPIVLYKSKSEIATDYTKKKNVLRLHLSDGSEYLLTANSQNEMVEWLTKIQFYACEYSPWGPHWLQAPGVVYYCVTSMND